MRRITRLAGFLSISLFLVATTSIASADQTAVSYPEVDSYIVSGVAYVPAPAQVEAAEIIKFKPKSMPVHREFRAAVSKDAQDRKGYEKSLYRGKYYHKDQEGFRKCVMKRESHHNYRAANRSSSARGAYQFLDNNWRDGLVHMMIKESNKNGDGLIPEMRELKNKSIKHWNRYYQDRAFFTALNFNGKWSGKKHWRATVPGTGC